MVSGYCFGASYVYKFKQGFDWFKVAPPLMAEFRVVIPYTGNKAGYTDTLIIQPFSQYYDCDAVSDYSYDTIRAVIQHGNAPSETLNTMHQIEQEMDAGIIPQFTLSSAQCALVSECDKVLAPQYEMVYKGWKTKWVYY